MDKIIEIDLRWGSDHLRGSQAGPRVRLVQEIHLQGTKIRLLQRKEEKINPLLKLHR